MNKEKKNNIIFLTILVASLLGSLYYLENRPSRLEITSKVQVIDGDTIEVKTTRVRLIGIDTPEKGECFAEEAKQKLSHIIRSKPIEIEIGEGQTDKYGRTLAYLYVDNLWINEWMVEEGYAKVMTVPPNTKYKNKLIKAETKAKENNKGLWKYCI